MPDSSDIAIDLNGPQWLALHQEIAGASPEDVLQWFVEPDLLRAWWAPEVEVDARVGGNWVMRWPSLDRMLTGEIAGITPTSLTVSWVWTNEPNVPARVLIVQTSQGVDGTTLHLTQGPYRQGDAFPGEDGDRASHIEGWEFFLPKLMSAIASGESA